MTDMSSEGTMSRQTGHRGTGNASLAGVREGLLIVAAAAETVLLAALVLIVAGTGQGSRVVARFLSLNAVLLRPFEPLPALSSSTPAAGGLRQIVAVVGYGAVLLVLVGVVAWLERRRDLY